MGVTIFSMGRTMAVMKTSINMRMATNCSRMGLKTSRAIIRTIRIKNRSFECNSVWSELNFRDISLYPVGLKNVAISLRVNPGSFPGLFDCRITGVGLTGSGVT